MFNLLSLLVVFIVVHTRIYFIFCEVLNYVRKLHRAVVARRDKDSPNIHARELPKYYSLKHDTLEPP